MIPSLLLSKSDNCWKPSSVVDPNNSALELMMPSPLRSRAKSASSGATKPVSSANPSSLRSKKTPLSSREIVSTPSPSKSTIRGVMLGKKKPRGLKNGAGLGVAGASSAGASSSGASSSGASSSGASSPDASSPTS